MIVKVIPSVGIKGKFKFIAPFDIHNNLPLKVTGIRSIFDYIEVGRNLLEDLYIPHGLTEEDFLEDKRRDVPIVTFVSKQRKIISLPANLIAELPTEGNDGETNFHWFHAITSLGLLPGDFDVTRIEEAIKQAVSEFIGVEPEVLIAVSETMEDINQEEAELAELTRQSAITYKSTALKDKMELERQLLSARLQIEELIRVIEDMQ